MKPCLRQSLIILILVVALAGSVMAAENTETYTFENVKSIDIYAITGSISITKNTEPKVVVTFENNLNNPELMDLEVDSTGGKLVLKENIEVNNPKGHSSWKVLVPGSMYLDSLICFSALQDIDLSDLAVGYLKCHASTGKINIDKVKSSAVNITTASKPISLMDCSILENGNIVSSSAPVDIFIDHLPAKGLYAASTGNEMTLSVDDFGDNFKMVLMKNEDKGRFECPFKCSTSETRKVDENDSFKTDICYIKQGEDGPEIKLSTGTGVIRVKKTAD